jgi:hypothetical protein
LTDTLSASRSNGVACRDDTEAKAFHAKSRLTKFPLARFVNTQWKGYMDVCLENVVKHFSNS